MRIGLITPRPDHPLLAETAALLTPRHQVEPVDPGPYGPGAEGPGPGGPGGAGPAAGPGAGGGPPADVYLLKARTPRALALARSLEERGAPVLNSAAATALCQDRTAMAEVARGAGLPFADTWTVDTLRLLAGEAHPGYPVVVKSRHSRRDDLVARVDDAGQLRGLADAWPDEPVVVQPFTANNGWDHKLWVIAGEVFAALRRSELADAAYGPTLPLRLAELPDGWLDLVLRVGTAFALDVYGVDVIDAGGGAPLIVDINAFPGIRGQAGAPKALAELALRTAERGAVAARGRR